MFHAGAWCNGNTWVSKTFVEGSSPSAPASDGESEHVLSEKESCFRILLFDFAFGALNSQTFVNQKEVDRSASFYEIKSSIRHLNTPAIFARVSARGVLVPCSHLLTSFCEQPIFSASCPCVMPDAIRCLAIGDSFPRSLGALRPSIFHSFPLSVIRRCDKIKEERERRRCCSALTPFSLA